MDLKSLIEELVLYYGEYENQHVKKMVANFLSQKIKIEEYKNLLQVIYSYHKANFKAPCIATIKECIDNARLKDNRYEPYRIKETNPTLYNYSKDPECEKGTKKVDLTGMLNKTIKKVER